ncbi:MAG: hypothetical protein HY011_26310 [Acidobacteria bacterium]|nr:hypothetical protein [Acidobacteriota bacterium]
MNVNKVKRFIVLSFKVYWSDGGGCTRAVQPAASTVKRVQAFANPWLFPPVIFTTALLWRHASWLAITRQIMPPQKSARMSKRMEVGEITEQTEITE